eukprot:14032859-Ditylum_brightwellii.AAC.1
MEHCQRKTCHLNQKSNQNWMTPNLPMKRNIRNINTWSWTMVSSVRKTGHYSCGVIVEWIFCNAQSWTLKTGKENLGISEEVP